MLRRGLCGKCAKPLVNEAILALGQLYHVNHLCCNYCETRICYIEESFIVDNKMACTRCFYKLSPKCCKCKRSVVNEYTVNGSFFLLIFLSSFYSLTTRRHCAYWFNNHVDNFSRQFICSHSTSSITFRTIMGFESLLLASHHFLSKRFTFKNFTFQH